MIQTSESYLTGIRGQELRPFRPLVAVEQPVFVVVQASKVVVGLALTAGLVFVVEQSAEQTVERLVVVGSAAGLAAESVAESVAGPVSA